jgi:hypothetical protein
MFSRRFASLLAKVGLVLLASTLIAAQRGKPTGPAVPKGEPITKQEPMKGTIEFNEQGGLLVADKSEKWAVINHLLKPPVMPKIRIYGSAKGDYLAAGQLVRFRTMWDKKDNKVKDPLAKVTVFTESPEYSMGKANDTDVTGAAATGTFTAMIMTGQIKRIKGTAMEVSVVGINRPLKLELAESVDVSIDIEVNNRDSFSLVKQGDTIEVSTGEKWLQQKCLKIVEAKITLAEPIVIASKKKGPREKPAAKEKEEKAAPEKPAKKEAAK